MSDKRPIDLKRDSAKSMNVGAPDEAITDFLTFQKRMLVIKTKSIYEVKLADQIDPQRTNINIPDTNQKVLNYGSETIFIGRTLLTAAELFKDRYLGKSADCDQCISFAFDAVKDVAAMNEIVASLGLQETAVLDQIQRLTTDRGNISLPSIGNIEVRTKEFIQKADHTLQSLFFIVKSFYPNQKNMFEGLTERITKTYGKDDPLSTFLASNLSFFQTIRHARNAVEHPKDDQRIACTDFSINAAGEIAPPLLELIDKKLAIEPMPLTKFMAEISTQVVAVFESTIAGLCDKHLQNFGGIRFSVFRFSEGEQGLSKHV